MENKIVVFLLLLIFCIRTNSHNVANEHSLNKTVQEVEIDVARDIDEFDIELFERQTLNQTKGIEKALQNVIKSAVKSLLPGLMDFGPLLSTKCMGGFMKYISGLTNTKVWALKMFDAMSKPPSGVMEGTWSDLGSYDMCLGIELPSRKGGIEFRGQYCAVEIRPRIPPAPRYFSLAKQPRAGPLDSFTTDYMMISKAFQYLQVRLGICVPSLCTLKEMQAVATQLGKQIEMTVKVPQCYIQQETIFKPIHIAVIFVLSLLLLLCVAGSIVEYHHKTSETERSLNKYEQILVCFSFLSNFQRLVSDSKGSKEMKALHGLRALSMAWVLLGHTYVWMNFHLWRRPEVLPGHFNNFHFGVILNGWLSVETFFLLSGLLTCYVVMKILPKTKGRINVPFFILRRYIRLTPLLLLVMGMVNFMPLLGSGPVWYERIEGELETCSKHWWRNIIYISNWMGIKNICVHPTWYLSADFQLYVMSIVFLYVLYRSPKLGLTMIAAFVAVCTGVVAALTTILKLPPFILISSGKDKEIEQTVDVIHLNTLTHAGPYFVGIVTGYFIIKYKEIKMKKAVVLCGWLLSVFFCLSAVYGGHQWNIGDHHGPVITAIYACLHRTTFTIGVAWVAFACVTGHGGLVNEFLSSSMLTPISRLTFVIYVMHPLVIWMRRGTQRERLFCSHYNALYEYCGHLLFSILVSIPIYLLLEAPLSNLERMVFSRGDETILHKPREDSAPNGNQHKNASKPSATATDCVLNVPVELMSVKSLEKSLNNLSFSSDIELSKNI